MPRGQPVETSALLVRSVPFGESDLVVTFFTRQYGKIATMVRGARRSTKRFGGALEPMHELSITFEDSGRELSNLKEAKLIGVRSGITERLEAMEAAGRALRWVRHLCPPRTPEPEVWARLTKLLDALDGGAAPDAPLASFGLGLLGDVGYGLDFQRCVRCGRECPPDRPAMIDASGLVCSACGGAKRKIKSDLRDAAIRGEGFDEAQARVLIDIVEDAMAAHADFDSSTR